MQHIRHLLWAPPVTRLRATCQNPAVWPRRIEHLLRSQHAHAKPAVLSIRAPWAMQAPEQRTETRRCSPGKAMPDATGDATWEVHDRVWSPSTALHGACSTSS
jgi:hypothetical protein